jgi:pSer/pThr/pTyr-binding forkhead associated (FHA) protein
MAASNIKVYVFQTETSGNTSLYDAYKELTTLSKGAYLFLPDKSGYQTGYSTILKTIDNNSKVYKVQFTSKEYVSDHTISTTMLGGNPASATDKEKCEPVDIQNPEVIFDDPKGGTGLEIRLKPGDTSQTIKAHVSWKDNKPRDIVKTELLANWEVVDTKTELLSSTDFILLKLPIQSLLGTKPQLHVDLMVRVTDAWGRKGENSITFDLIAPPAPTVTSPAPPTPTPKKEAQNITPPIFTKPDTNACKGKFSLKCAADTVKGNWFVITIIGIIAVLFILLISTRRQLGRISAPAREAFGKRVEQVRDQVRKTLLGGASHQQVAIAYLQVLMARSDRVGAKIELYNNRTTLGRDPSVTDVQLYNPDDKTSVSGLHCTIFYDPGQEKFLITDDNSTNGTYVNGKRLAANEPTDLNDEDEIILGDVYRQGAKLRFEIAASHPVAAPEVELAPIAEDFNVDLEAGTSVQSASFPEPLPSRSDRPKKDFDETVPGYRDDEGLASTDNQPAPPSSPPPGSSQKKGKDKSWLDKLG